MKLADVLNFPQVAQELNEQKLPFNLVYKLAKLTKAASSEIEFYRSQLKLIIDDCAELDEDGNTIPTSINSENDGIKIRADKVDECNKRYAELQEVEISMPVMLKASELEGLELTLNQMKVLMPFIEE